MSPIPAGQRPARDKGTTHAAVSIAALSSNNVDLDVSGGDELRVLAKLAAAAAAGDVGLEVRPYEDDGTTLHDQELATLSSVAAAVVGTESLMQKAYDVTGVDKVQVRAKNNHATLAKNVTVTWFLAVS